MKMVAAFSLAVLRGSLTVTVMAVYEFDFHRGYSLSCKAIKLLAAFLHILKLEQGSESGKFTRNSQGLPFHTRS
jgi:hypothetical protein